MQNGLDDAGRRTLLRTFVHTLVVTIGGGLAGILGAFAVPRAGTSRERWVRAARLEQLQPNVPFAAVVSVPREQGWYRERAQDVVFLTWDGKDEVRALSATCTHLGCRVHWDAEGRAFRCPCHGGAYDAKGAVSAGPPPRPLAAVAVRLQGGDGTVLVRL
jgi:Rieske Fe-S protein